MMLVEAKAWYYDGETWSLWGQQVEVDDLKDIGDVERRVYAALRAAHPDVQAVDYGWVTAPIEVEK